MSGGRGLVRTWALIAVAVTSAALIGFSAWLIWILAAKDWCTTAAGMAKYADGAPDTIAGSCFGLLTRQVDALAINSHIALGTLALCLAVLVVIVLAGGKLKFTASKDGVTADIERDVDEAAQEVADAAQIQANEIKGTQP